MADIFNKEKRSEIMKKIKSEKNESTELKLIEIFKKYQIKKWRRKYPVKGRPDFVFLDKRIAVFVDGCFWHGHLCRNTIPKSNECYWREKIKKNIKRDEEVTKIFEKRNWKVVRIWECELKNKNRHIMEEKLMPLMGK